MWSLEEIDERRESYAQHKDAERRLVENPLSPVQEIKECRTLVAGVGLYIRSVLDRPNPFGPAEFVEVGFQGSCLAEETENDFVYVRYSSCYGGADEMEVCRVADRYAKWLSRMGLASVITEEDAAMEAAYIRKFVKRTEPFTREEALEHIRRNYSCQTSDMSRVQSVIDALADDEITTLADEQKWSEILDLIGLDSFVPEPDPELPLIQLNNMMGNYQFTWSSARTCIGGSLHGMNHDNQFLSVGHPPEYEDTDIHAGDGTLFMRVWTHKSLDTPEKRSAAFGAWYESIHASLPEAA